MSDQVISESGLINRPRQIVWECITTSENWKQWYGYDLINVTPGWQQGATLVFATGDKTAIKQCVAPELLQFGGSTVRLSDIDSSTTKFEYSMAILDNDPRHMANMREIFNDTFDRMLKKLKSLLESA